MNGHVEDQSDITRSRPSVEPIRIVVQVKRGDYTREAKMLQSQAGRRSGTPDDILPPPDVACCDLYRDMIGWSLSLTTMALTALPRATPANNHRYKRNLRIKIIRTG